MKQKLYIIGIATTLMMVVGAMFKVNHLPGAGIMICLGTVMLLIGFLPAALINNYKAYGNRQNLLLYIITYITCLLIFTSMLFKIQHWPYSSYILYIALPFPFVIFLPVWLYVTSRIKNFDINNTIYVLILLAIHAVFAGLLALNASKARVENETAIVSSCIRPNEVSSEKVS